MPRSYLFVLRPHVLAKSLAVLMLSTCFLPNLIVAQLPTLPTPQQPPPDRASGRVNAEIQPPGTLFLGDQPVAAPGDQATIEILPGEPLQYFGNQTLVPDDYFSESVPPDSLVDAPLGEYLIVPPADLGTIRADDIHIKQIEPGDELTADPNFYSLSVERYRIYRSNESLIAFMPGGGDQFGWLSFESPSYLSRKRTSGPTANVNFHLLSGPSSIDLPARLYDFELGYQTRSSLSELFSYDASVMVGAYSDFKGSAREGVRFPAHAVGMFHSSENADWVIGVDYLGRDDVKMLPVAGFCWHNPARPQLRYQMVFPRPRIDLTLNAAARLYLAGLFGGGTWQVEFPDASNDVLTYRDFKMVTGIERKRDDGSLATWELGWVFARKLSFRDRADELNMDDAFVLRYITRH